MRMNQRKLRVNNADIFSIVIQFRNEIMTKKFQINLHTTILATLAPMPLHHSLRSIVCRLFEKILDFISLRCPTKSVTAVRALFQQM